MPKHEILINNVPYPVRFGTRSLAIFGELTGRNIATISQTMTVEEMYKSYFSAIVAGCARENIPCLEWPEFYDAIDDSPEILTKLAEIKAAQESPGE